MISEYIKYLFLSASFFLFYKTEEIKPPEPVFAPDSTSITLLFTGDVMQHMPQIEAAWNTTDSAYNYSSCFKHVKPIISGVDFAIANLECTLAGKPYSGYPQFSAPDELAIALRDAGFDILATANNHSCDRGNQGLIRTLDVVDNVGLSRTGTFRDSADFVQHNPLILSKNDITFALFNYSYGTNGIPFYPPVIVNLIDTTRIITDLKSVKKPETDFVIVFFHWGNEYQSQPSDEQTGLAKLCRKYGADVVIGSHPHVLQRMEYEQSSDSMPAGHLVVYSLGNYVSNQRDRYRDGGAMIGFTLSKTWNDKKVIDPRYQLTWVHTAVENEKKQYYILPVKQFESDTTLDHTSLTKLRQFADDSRLLLNGSNLMVPEK